MGQSKTTIFNHWCDALHEQINGNTINAIDILQELVDILDEELETVKKDKKEMENIIELKVKVNILIDKLNHKNEN